MRSILGLKAQRSPGPLSDKQDFELARAIHKSEVNCLEFMALAIVMEINPLGTGVL